MLQALIIVFREGFESFLTVAIIFAYLKKTGRTWLRPAVWWGIGVAVIASAALGYVLLDPASGRTGSFAQGFAAGALLAMITDTMLPESYDVEQVSTGALVAIGFAISLMLSAI